MAKKVPVVLSLEPSTTEQLKTNKRLTSCEMFSDVPEEFVSVITEFMVENVGFSSGPIFCVTRLGGESACLSGSMLNEDNFNSIIDMLVSSANNVIIEFSVDSDTLVSIGFEEFNELCDQFAELEGAEDVTLDMLRDSLQVGVDVEDATVISFLPSLQLKDCARYFRITDNLEISGDSIFSGAEEITIAKINKFK